MSQNHEVEGRNHHNHPEHHRPHRGRPAVLIVPALIMALGIGYGLSLVGKGLAAKAGDAITVTGSARTNAVSDNAVWTLNVSETSQTAGQAVKKVGASVIALEKYLTDGGIPASAVEEGPVNTNANNEYINGNATGRVLSYQANQQVTARSKDVKLVLALSNGIGKLLQTGVNVNNYGPAFYVSTLSSLRPQLLSEAMKDAKVKAEAITSATGGKVGAVLSAASGPFQVTTTDSVDTSSGGYYDTTTINKTVTATVTVNFKVKN